MAILFRERFRAPILARVKRVTRRTLGRNYRLGAVHQLYTRPPWLGGRPFARARIESVRDEPLSAITEREARLEGFRSLAEFWTALRDIYPDASPAQVVRRIEFELV